MHTQRFLALPVAVVLSFNSPLLGQVPVEITAGIHYGATVSGSVEHNLLEEYWKPSLDVGVRTTIPVTTWFNIVPFLAYNHYLFHSYYPTVNYSDTARVFVSSTGQSSNVIRGMLELQFIDQSSRAAKPYLVIGGGYVYEHFGTMYGRMEYLNYVKYSKDITLPDDSYFAYTLGVGGMVPLLTDWVVDFSFKYYSDTKIRSYGLLNLGIGYRIL